MPAGPFAIAVLPDTQFYSESFPEQFVAQTHWIVDNRAAEHIVLVSHLGDIVQNGGRGRAENAAEWSIADAAMGLLDINAPELPYGVAVGNHDYDEVNSQSRAEQYVSYFGESRYSGRLWYGGSSPDQLNHYQRFSADGHDYLHITLEWRPRPSSLSWAQSVLDENPNVPTIVSTHEYLSPFGARTWAGNDIFNELVDHNSQVFMVLSGHHAGEGHQTAINAAGLEVFEMVANYQMRPEGGDGWMRLIEFDGTNDRINMKTYSPTLDEFKVDPRSQFTLNVNFASRLGAAPEPSTLGLIAAGVAGVICYRRRRRKQRANPQCATGGDSCLLRLLVLGGRCRYWSGSKGRCCCHPQCRASIFSHRRVTHREPPLPLQATADKRAGDRGTPPRRLHPPISVSHPTTRNQRPGMVSDYGSDALTEIRTTE